MLLSSIRYCYTLALLAFALILPTIRAVPYSKSTHNSILASLNKPQKGRHNAHTAEVPGLLKARGPGDQVGHPASLTHTMKRVPGSFKSVATIVPVREAAAAL